MPDFTFKPANCAAQVQTLEEFNQTCLKVTQIPNHTNQAELFVQVDASECEVVTCIASTTVNPTLSHQDWILRRPVHLEFVWRLSLWTAEILSQYFDYSFQSPCCIAYSTVDMACLQGFMRWSLLCLFGLWNVSKWICVPDVHLTISYNCLYWVTFNSLF